MEILLILLLVLTTFISLWVICFIIGVCFEKIFNKKQKAKQVDVDDNNEEYIYICPKCGSKDIGYLTLLHHFETQKDDTNIPVYSSSARCNNCFFKTKSYIDDTEDSVLKELRRIKNED